MQTLIHDMVKNALTEDVGSGDISALLIPEQQEDSALIVTREDMILCGSDWVTMVFKQLSPSITIQWCYHDGAVVPADSIVCKLQGNTRALLTGERTALNFLQTLSAVATTTAHYVNALKTTTTRLLDTRKTIPLWRVAEKYAVRCGGGYNHRMGLFDAFLIKENHIKVAGSITAAIQAARDAYHEKTLEVEVENLAELSEALLCLPDIIMLDNFSLASMSEAVKIVAHRIKLEASGNISLDNIAAVAATGVDFISVGNLTKNIRAIDLSMRIK